MSDDERDLIDRLGDQLTAAAERQASARRGWRGWLRPAAERQASAPRGWRGWLRRRSTRTLVLVGAGLALAGAGGAAGLLAPRGEVGGPPALTFARLAPEQQAAGLRELTRPIVIGRGRLPESGRAWQLVAFQTTRGLCIAIDFPGEHWVGGGCGSDRPQGGRVVDWQGAVGPLGRHDEKVLVGAVRRDVPTVRVAHGYAPKGRREVVDAEIVHVEDPRVLAHLDLDAPFAYWVAELTGDVNHGKVVAYDAAGERLGAKGVPWIAGWNGFMPRDRSCVVREPDELRPVDARILLPAGLRESFGVFDAPQRAEDRPAGLVRELTRGIHAFAWSTVDLDSIRRVGTGHDGRPLYLFVHTGIDWDPRHDCLRSAPPRLRAIERRQERAMQRNARTAHVSLVDDRGHAIAGVGDQPWRQIGYGSRGLPSEQWPAHARARGGKWVLLTGVMPDGVASVELTFRGGLRRTAQVRDNHFLLFVPLGSAATRVTRQVWRDHVGRVLQRRGR